MARNAEQRATDAASARRRRSANPDQFRKRERTAAAKRGEYFAAYQQTPEYRATRRRRGQRKQSEFEAMKRSRGCLHCGYDRNGAVLQLHHRDPSTKLFRPDADTWMTPAGQAELAKCDLLCANCHHEVHHARD